MFFAIFAANFVCLNVSLGTIPSVLGEYKTLQVVRCVKNKYLLLQLFFADLEMQKDQAPKRRQRQKNLIGQLDISGLSLGKSRVDAPCGCVAGAKARHCKVSFYAVFARAFDLTACVGRRCFVGNLFQVN